MIIKHTNGEVTDTNKLNDLSAEIMEAQASFTDTLCRLKVPFVALVMDPVGGKLHSSMHITSNKEIKDVLSAVQHFVRGYNADIVPKDVAQKWIDENPQFNP